MYRQFLAESVVKKDKKLALKIVGRGRRAAAALHCLGNKAN